MPMKIDLNELLLKQFGDIKLYIVYDFGFYYTDHKYATLNYEEALTYWKNLQKTELSYSDFKKIRNKFENGDGHYYYDIETITIKEYYEQQFNKATKNGYYKALNEFNEDLDERLKERKKRMANADLYRILDKIKEIVNKNDFEKYLELLLKEE